jgi:hypothetical protein
MYAREDECYDNQASMSFFLIFKTTFLMNLPVIISDQNSQIGLPIMSVANNFYLVRTRRLPLYTCSNCGHQTTITVGIVMEKS